MFLDPQVAALYGSRLQGAPPHPPSIEQARIDADSLFHDKDGRGPALFHCEDRKAFSADSPSQVPVPVRIYTPFFSEETLPAILYFHGGGFVMHNIASHDSLCRKLALECSCIVISADYRLAPEHKHPACMEDGETVLRWTLAHGKALGINPQKLILAGDSAGASISAVLSLTAREKADSLPSHKICLQVLCYGSFGCLAHENSESMELYGQGGYVLPQTMLDWCMSHYIPKGADCEDFRLNPGRARDLSRLPATLSITAQCDPLRDDGEAFARRLAAAGNSVEQYRAPGLMHGFLLYWERLDGAQKVLSLIGETVRNLFS